MKQDLIDAAADVFKALLAVGFVFFMYCFVQMVDDNHLEQEKAKEALIEQRVQERFEKAAQEACGPNAAWRETDNAGEIVCVSKKGKTFGRVAL